MYRIFVIVLLLYAVFGVTYVLLRGNNCECYSKNIDNALSISTSPTIEPTIEPTIDPTMEPTASPILSMNSDLILPQNAIVLWNDCSNIPIGWTLCDGDNNTPDLRGRFIIGADNETFVYGQNGGDVEHSHIVSTSATVLGHALTLSQIPPHNHNNGAWQYLLRITGSATGNNHDGGNEPDIITAQPIVSQGGGQAHSHGISVSSSASSTSHLPPYYVMCYIMKNDTQNWNL